MQYLKKKALIFECFEIALIWWLVLLSFFLGNITDSLAWKIADVILLSVATGFAIILMETFAKERAGYKKGDMGERRVWEVLRKLYPEFAFFKHILSEARDIDVDFLVIGPNGLFAIEVKEVTGKITYSPSSQKININGSRQNYLAQVRHEAAYVQEKIGSRFDIAFVRPVLVFTAPGSRVLAKGQMGLVEVMHIEDLEEFMRSARPYPEISLEKQNKIIRMVLQMLGLEKLPQRFAIKKIDEFVIENKA
jgi:hypothetical protein